ncbi:MAG TPA: Maf family protein, partial [Burkholderiaceae bacterium]|nr:Maf family protein [Burkholderiaceae bacterium]
MKIYLASQSPRRQELLRQIGVEFDLLLPDADEDAERLEAERAGEAPLTYVKRVVHAKALAAAERLMRRALPARPILVADTTVALGRTILHKPLDAKDNARMLRALSGTTHRVLTGIAVVHVRKAHTRIDEAVSESFVTFKRLSPRDIRNYLASGEGMGKAGGYAIQGLAAAFIPAINGSYSNVVGLPLA